MKKLLLLILGFNFFVSCAQTNEKKDETANKDTVFITDTIDYKALNIDSAQVKEINNLTYFIAGMPVAEDYRLYSFTKSNVWKSYSNQANSTWKSFFSKNEIVKKWADAELIECREKCSTILYPFSGPDILFPEIMFPQSKDVYMIGLEDIGTIPTFNKPTLAQLDTVFEKYKRAINEVIKFSFFMTKKMKIELANNDISGTAPIIMLFLVRSGKTILKVEPVTISDEGKVIAVASFKDARKLNNKGVCFYYHNEGSNELRKITYFSTNLADGTLSINKPMLALFESLNGNVATYVKSASYLMHKTAFSTIRNTLLKKSQFHLQDDSGIPYRYFDKKEWSIQLYGSYIKPIPLFEKSLEKDLALAYKNAKPKPISFRIGYHPKSNMLIAKKLNLK